MKKLYMHFWQGIFTKGDGGHHGLCSQQNENFESLTNYVTNSVEPEPEGSSPYSQQIAKVPILSQLDTLYTRPASLPIIHSDLILPSTSWSSKLSISFWLSH
jgi:hypothetical protein